MFDTHCHLNFKAFKKNLDEVIGQAYKGGIQNILIPGTDVETSKKAVEIANKYEGVHAAVGIHPHHVYEIKGKEGVKGGEGLDGIEKLLQHKKVVAVGEVGLDRHVYQETKYESYQIDEEFINLQKELLIKQIKLAVKYNKSLIIHNREAVEDILEVLKSNWNTKLEGRTVFHCCEPEDSLLNLAKEYKIFIGVDGDITYRKDKQEFIKKMPLGLLVLETDSPFLLPEPLRSQKKYPNVPANLKIIAEFIADILGIKTEELAKITMTNSQRLFNLPKN